GGAATGLGVGPRAIHGVLGITKAYTTRVGSGPFPTELLDERGRTIAARGDEFGATTGRPRRCGWFDAVAVRYTCRINGVDRIALTKPDVLDGSGEIQVCTGYGYKGEILRTFPCEPWILETVTPVWKTISGWKDSVHGASDAAALPPAFKDYVRLIEDLVETRVAIISTGVERQETILLDDGLADLVDFRKLREDPGR
ncbi:MAG: adenylosuccinate synthetase, partial [Acidobacteriota bacterium]